MKKTWFFLTPPNLYASPCVLLLTILAHHKKFDTTHVYLGGLATNDTYFHKELAPQISSFSRNLNNDHTILNYPRLPVGGAQKKPKSKSITWSEVFFLFLHETDIYSIYQCDFESKKLTSWKAKHLSNNKQK